MEAIFGPESYLFDPSANYDSNSFLSFSSLSNLSPPSWADLPLEPKEPAPRSVSDASSPSPSNPFEIITSAFESAFSTGENIGIFHTPTKSAGSSETRPQPVHPRSSSSSDSWGTPITPSLTNRSSSDTFAFNAGSELDLTPSQIDGFSWDEGAPSLGGPSYTLSTPIQQAHRVTSNPVLGSSRQPRSIKPITSMPALKEEEQAAAAASQWFDPSDFLDGQSFQIPAGPNDRSDKAEEALVDDFDWVFGDYGLGDAVSADTTLFAAFQSDLAPAIGLSSKSAGLDAAFEPTPTINVPPVEQSWLPEPLTQDVVGLAPTFDLTQQTTHSPMVSFTIDPMAVMGTNGMDEESSRPSSAPGLNGGEGSRGMLSVPMADIMTRSLSSEGYVPSRSAPHRDLFSYAPQQIPSGPPGPQPLYTCDPSPSYNALGPAHPHAMPLTPTHTRRSASNGLTIQINPPPFSTYVPSPLPPTPQSATFPPAYGGLQPQPMPMQRAGTNPLPAGVKGMGITFNTSSVPKSAGLPPHLARAQAIVQMQEAKEEAERQAIRQETASRRVGMAEASVMQPQGQRLPQQTIMGWEGPSAQTGSMPVLTNTPLVVHPPPVQYNIVGAPMMPHRVHPPPHPGNINTSAATRPIARLPTSPAKGRKASATAAANPSSTLSPTHTRARTTPSKSRSPSGRRKAAMAPGTFSWGETTFINFTSDDAEKLLTGVAPSGSQSKRKREEEAAVIKDATLVPMLAGAEERERSKRSRSNE